MCITFGLSHEGAYPLSASLYRPWDGFCDTRDSDTPSELREEGGESRRELRLCSFWKCSEWWTSLM